MELLMAMGIAAVFAIGAYRLPSAAQRMMSTINRHRLARRGIQSLDNRSFDHAEPTKAPGDRLVDGPDGEAGLRWRARQALRRVGGFGRDPRLTGALSVHTHQAPESARAARIPPIGAD